MLLIADYNSTLSRIVKECQHALAEAYGLLNKTKRYVDMETRKLLDRVERMIREYNVTLNRIMATRLGEVGEKLGAIERRVTTVEEEVSRLNLTLGVKVEELEKLFQQLTTQLEAIEDMLASLNVTRWIALAREVEVLAGLYSTVYNRTQVLESRMAGLQAEAAKVGLLESKVNSLEAKLAALESRLASLVARVASLESSLKQYYNYTQAMLQHYYTYISDRDARLKSKITMLEYSLLATTSLGLVAAAAASLMLGVSMRRFYTTGAG